MIEEKNSWSKCICFMENILWVSVYACYRATYNQGTLKYFRLFTIARQKLLGGGSWLSGWDHLQYRAMFTNWMTSGVRRVEEEWVADCNSSVQEFCLNCSSYNWVNLVLSCFLFSFSLSTHTLPLALIFKRKRPTDYIKVFSISFVAEHFFSQLWVNFIHKFHCSFSDIV